MSARTLVSILAGIAFGMLAAWAFVVIERVGAQTAGVQTTSAAADVAIAPGPGGMWIVRGNELRVCSSGPVPAGYELIVPTCGDAVRLDR